jgi:TctA family transporter
MSELFPFAAGLLLGAILGAVRPALRPSLAVVGAVVLGVMATVISGEFKASWEYLLFDIPLVAVSAVLGFLVARRVQPAPRRRWR